MRWPWKKRVTDVEPRGSFMVEAEIHRTEDLLVDAPSEDEIRHDMPHDPWRPSRTLGPINYRGGR